MSELRPITPDSQVCEVLTCVPEKFVIDFANSIDVTRDHLRVQKQRSDFFSRCCDGFSGQAGRRQSEINTRVANGLEATLTCLVELATSQSKSNFAIARINDRVNELKQDVARIADFSVDTRLALNALCERVDVLSSDLHVRLDEIDLWKSADLCINTVFEKWRAGLFGCFSPAGRCYAALEELRWGGLGNYLYRDGPESQNFLTLVANRATSQLREDAKAPSPLIRLDTRQYWLSVPFQNDAILDAAEALVYLGDKYDESSQPYSYSISQQISELPDEMPLLINAQKLSKKLVSEVLGGATYGE